MSNPPNFYGRSDQWPEGPFPRAKDPATRLSVETFAAIASTVRAERARRHWSQERLAAEAGVARTSVTALENGTSWSDLFIIIKVGLALDQRLGFIAER